ncbi:hypothetical protein F5141DRAFT_1185318 [Pisolithus sp. B1]|nr:hypothetical protein F5141DRAFT_1185318 [Pisolithus sp. B1]
MAAFSVTTVVLSLHDGCPGLPFYVLEVIINTSMILEVSMRLVAFGRQFWKSPFNVFDLILTVFCAMTLLLLLIARNVLQFGRLASVMRQSGQSIFSRPKPIDITAVRRAGYTELDLGLEDEDEDPELGRPLVRDSTLFDAEGEEGEERSRMSAMPRAAQAIDERDAVDVWAEIG